MQALYTISEENDVTDRYLESTPYGCLDANIMQNVEGARAYSLPGDYVAIYVDISIDGNITYKNGSVVPLHGHIANDKNLADDDEDVVVRGKRDVANVLDSVAAFQNAKLAYFMNLLVQNHYKTVRELLISLCSKALDIFAIWKMQSEINPSKVVSHFLKKDVIVRREGDIYKVLSCASFSRYSILPNMKIDRNKCYSRPLITLNNNSDIIFQLGLNNRIITPPIYFEKCKDKHIAHFVIDDQQYQFVNYQRNVNFVTRNEDVLVISPNTNQFYDIERMFYDVKHVTLYQKGEISIGLVDPDEVLDYINQELDLKAKFGNAFANALLKFDNNTVYKQSDVMIFFSNIMENVIFLFSNPLMQTIAIFIVFVATIFNWLRLFYTCCKKPKVTIFQKTYTNDYTKIEDEEEDAMM